MKKIKITIPVRSLWSAGIALAILGFAYLQAVEYIIPGFKEILHGEFNISDIKLLWVPAVSYLIVVTFTCMVVQTIKGKKLNSYKEIGLISGLIKNFFFGLIMGIAMGLIMGIIIGIIYMIKLGDFKIFVETIIYAVSLGYVFGYFCAFHIGFSIKNEFKS